MKANAKRWVGYLGYPTVYFLMLGFFARCTFPYDQVRDRLVAEFNAKQASSGMRLEIAEMSGYWLSGIEAEGVKLTRTATADGGGTPSAEEQKPKVTVIDELYGSVSLVRLLFGKIAGSFGATIQSGEIEGNFSSSETEQSLAVKLRQVGVGDIPILSDLAGLPLKGTVDGQLEVVLPEKKPGKAEGNVELNITGLAAGDGKAKVLKVIALPELKVGSLKLVATITDGRVKFDTVTAKGPDFEMVMDGSIRLREPVTSSMLDLGMRFSFMDAYKNKNDITKGLFGSAGVPGLFEMDEKVRRAKREDGFYGWRVVGTMEKPLFEPSPAGTAGGARASTRGSAARRVGKTAAPNGAPIPPAP
jgi:type II secretion system protein N